jgi:nucleoside-diphosphate-sugar epimerase
MSAILVTGASGLIGSHILLELLQQGNTVRALTRNSNNAEAFITRLLSHYSLDATLISKIEWIEGDLRDVARYDSFLHSVETVFHCAGIISTAPADRTTMHAINVQCTCDLVNHCLNSSLKWFGHMSSVATLGPNPEGLVDEDFFWKQDKNQSAYALSKYLSEQEVWRAKEEGLPVCVFNPSVVIGPTGENGNLHKLVRQLKKGLTFYLNGRSGFVDVRDLAKFCVLQWKKNTQGARIIVNAENLTQQEFLKRICLKINASAPKYSISKSLFRLASIAEKFLKFNRPQNRILHKDLFKMGSSANRYDNRKSIEMGAIYHSTDDAINNMVKFNSRQEI